MRQPWDAFSREVRARIGVDDDEGLWRAAIDRVFRDAEFLCDRGRSKAPIFAQIGACSHWLSPHNNGSWLADARYAWPSGYGGSGHCILGLPEFDWSVIRRWNPADKEWNPAREVQGKRPLTFRVAVPAHTARHARAVVHALWTPGTPTISDARLVQAYGFLKTDAQWFCTSTFGDGSTYETLDAAT